MTRRETERGANFLHELAVAAVVGGVGDWVIVGLRAPTDLVGIAMGLLCLAGSMALTRKLGGPTI